MASSALTRRAILAQAWPIMLAQASIPMVGVVDTVVIGRTGDAVALAGVALGTTIINFLFWSFGFLRMGMSGLTAQAKGAGEPDEVRALLLRGLMAGGATGLALFALQVALVPLLLGLFAGEGALDGAARAYIAARFWSAPALLAGYAINGWLLGLGRTRAALAIQLVQNIANAALDIMLVWHFALGAAGVGYGTAAADWIALALGLAITRSTIGRDGWRALRQALADRAALARLFAVNADIMVRTIALLALFAWFANAGARLGTVPLAANQVLMQFVSIAAFVLDGFAFTAESRIGQAVGARSRPDFLRAFRLTGEFSLGAALLFSAGIALAGLPLIHAMTTDPAVRAAAGAVYGLTALVPLIGAPAWLLDGVFIGATRGRALRNAALVSTGLYILTDLALRPLGATGIWLALLASYVYRAAALGTGLPGLLATLARPRDGA